MILSDVDKIEITVLVDNYTDLMRTDNSEVIKRPSLPDGNVLLAEHGLSLLIRFWSGKSITTVLMDTGGSEVALKYNSEKLGVDISDISAIIISHGHDDHLASTRLILKSAKRSIPVYIHPDAFSKRRKILPDKSKLEIKPPDRKVLQKAGAEFILTPEPVQLCQDKILITGDIERITKFERINPVYYIEKAGVFIPDLFHDDQAVILSIKDKGLVVITGCAHSGIINTIEYARKITGIDQIYVIIGGFHLSGSFYRTIIESTISALKEIDPTYIIPMHCTGWEAINRISEEISGKFIINTVGSTYRFGN